MKTLWEYVCWKVFHVSQYTATLAYCFLISCPVITGLYLLVKKIQPFLLVDNCYKYIKCIKKIHTVSYHEIPLAICLLKGISCVSTHHNTGLLLFYSMSSNYWAVFTGEKIQPFLLVNNCYKYIKCIKLISVHEIPLAICLLKGISNV